MYLKIMIDMVPPSGTPVPNTDLDSVLKSIKKYPKLEMFRLVYIRKWSYVRYVGPYVFFARASPVFDNIWSSSDDHGSLNWWGCLMSKIVQND